ncbi:MAG: serine hydrolase [Prevotellaceae bacterium]|nr:serine hydrolase [Prevotellaceae bacterium]
MKRLLLLFVLLWGCCGHFASDAQRHPALPEVLPPVEPMILQNIADKEACRQWVDSVMEQLTLEERVGQLFIFTIAPQKDKANRTLLQKVVRQYHVGGLLFSGGQIENQVDLTNEAQQVAKIPLMITFDGEWGLSMRLKGTPVFPKNAVLGCIRDNSLLNEYGKEMARECREVGVQVNFSPVADVNINPKNPVINVRSFGELTQNVTDKVIAYATGLEAGGVLSVGKHFPGHGDTEVDSHKALPTLPFTRERLDSIELYPFKHAIKAGMSGIMVGHLAVPALEPEAGLPSSLSHNIVTGLLTDELQFQGLIFTDALAMKGVAGHSSLCLAALQAGNDLLLVPQNIQAELESVVKAVKQGELDEKTVEQKCRKVLTYKYALGLSQTPRVNPAGLKERVDAPYTRDLIDRLHAAAITAIGNEPQVLPLDSTVQEVAVLHIGPAAKAKPFIEALSEHIRPVAFQLPAGQPAKAYETLKAKLSAYPCVLVSITETNLAPYTGFFTGHLPDVPTVNILFTTDKQAATLGEGLTRTTATLLGHSAEEAVQRGAARIVCGEAVADGFLSAAIGTWIPAGAGISIGAPAVCEEMASEADGAAAEAKEGKAALTVGPTVEVPGIDAVKLAKIDTIAQEGVDQGAYPGCQVIVLKDGQPVYHKAFGTHTGGAAAGETEQPVLISDVYDIASLTKTTATLLAVMKLYDDGRLKLTDRLGDYLPRFKGTDKRNITLQDLLFHQSGLPATILFYLEAIDKDSYTGTLFKSRPDRSHTARTARQTWANPSFRFIEGLTSAVPTDEYTMEVSDSLWLHRSFKDTYLQKILDTPLKDKRYRYSCVGFILLQQVVETITGMPMDEYLAREFYIPMGLTHTGYLPLRFLPRDEIVPSSKDPFLRKVTLQGYVHDESAAFLGGVSGNAGLFSNAQEVAHIYQMLLNGGEIDGKRYFSEETCRLFTTKVSTRSRRGLGFDKPDTRPGTGPCCDEAPATTYGHTGFTGTCAWVDPDNGLVYVFLSNRTYPDSWNTKLSRLDIRGRIQSAVYEALSNE